MTKNRSENFDKWIAALRSGDYNQTTGTLWDQVSGYGAGDPAPCNSYCCLGVAEVLRTADEHPKGDLPGPALADWLGIKMNKTTLLDTWDPMIDLRKADEADLREYDLSRIQYKVSVLNDEHRLSFEAIADLLDKYGIVG